MAGFFRLSAATSLLDCRSEGGKRDKPKVWRAFHLDYGATRKTERSDVILSLQSAVPVGSKKGSKFKVQKEFNPAYRDAGFAFSGGSTKENGAQRRNPALPYVRQDASAPAGSSLSKVYQTFDCQSAPCRGH